MSPDQVRRNVIRGAASGYVRILGRMLLGLVTFRLLYQGLDAEAFGFWSLLWAIFGYGVLLDFGFGYAAQKRVAELSVKRDYAGLSRVLSSILGFYALIAAVAVGLGILGSGWLVDLFGVSPPNRESYRQILMLFLVGIGLAFPLGVFPEILQGQQRMVLANNLALATNVLNFGCVAAVVAMHWSFRTLVILALVCVLIPYVAAAWLALRHMPQVQIRARHVSRSALLDTGRFSVYAYLNLMGNVLRNKADQPVIGSILGVAAVTPYQASGKVGEMFGLLTKQIADVLSPTAAHLHARGDHQELRAMLVGGIRFSVLAATPLYLLAAAYLPELLGLLTGVAQPTAAMLWSGQLLLFWYYSLVLTHWVFKRMFLMAGQERRMMWQGVIEALCNLALSIGLTWYFRSIVGVAWGSVLPTVVAGWGWLWGWAAREAHLSRWQLFRQTVLPAWLGCLPMILAIGIVRAQPFWPSGAHPALVLLEGGFLGLVGIAGLWRTALNPAERERFGSKFRSRWRRVPAPVKA